MSERPDILSHDAGYFDGEQYMFDAKEIKECIDWADQLEEKNEELRMFEGHNTSDVLRAIANEIERTTDCNHIKAPHASLARRNWLYRFAALLT